MAYHTGECCFGVMYVEWGSGCDLFSAVDVYVNYGGVYAFHVCFDLCILCGVVCFLSLGVAM